VTNKANQEERIGEWRQYLGRHPAVHSADVEELEDHLRSQIDALRGAGLDEDEAFLVAVKRLGDLNALSREFAIEYSERLWKQLEFGFTPNKTAALGLNLLLLVNLGGSAVLYARFLRRRAPFARLERWQTAYLPAFAVWAWIVTVFFPVIFNYR